MCDVLKKIRGKEPEEILKEFYPKETIPIDVVDLAQNIGIKLSGVDFTKMEKDALFKKEVEKKGNILGSVFVKDEDVEISYSTKLSNESVSNLSDIDIEDKLKKRQRFTIAHEIAHCCLHMKDGNGSHIEYRTEQTDYSDAKEREANIFAGKLLMPSNLISIIADILDYNLSLTFLSNLFKVSKNVVKARLDFLIYDEKVLPIGTRIYN